MTATETTIDTLHDAMSVSEVAQQAREALAGGTDAAFVMHVPSGMIVASRPAAAMLLDPQGREVEGHRLEEFTSDEPSGALALLADGRIKGYEVSRTLTRPGKDYLRVSLRHKRFAHHSSSRFALVVMTVDLPDVAETDGGIAQECLHVIGAVSGAGVIEQIGSESIALFGEPPTRLLGRPVSALVDSADTEKWKAATSKASTGELAVSLVVRACGARDPALARSAAVACEVLLLPLRPGFTFIFLPSVEGAAHRLDAGGVRSMLMDLSRVAGLAQTQRQKISSLGEQDLPGLNDLTLREREIFTRLIAGYRVGSIAADLVLSASTVRTHLASIFVKLGVSNQSELISAVRSSRPARGWSELYPSWQIDQ